MSVTINGTTGITTPDVITDDLTVDTNTLYVDATNNRVGIGTSSPATNLVVNTTGVQGLQLTDTSTDSSPRILFTNDTNTWGVYNNVEDLSFRSGAIIGSSSGTERMRIDSSGYVGIGTSPSTTLHVKSPTTTPGGQFAATIEQAKTNNATATTGLRVKYTSVTPVDTNHIFRCEDSGGTYRFYVQNNGAYGGTSDRTLKENIVDATDKLADLRKIKVRNYNWIEHGPEGGLKELGFIAQEVEEVFPKLVKENPETGKKTLLDSVFVPILVKALQEAADKIDVLETRIEALEAK